MRRGRLRSRPATSGGGGAAEGCTVPRQSLACPSSRPWPSRSRFPSRSSTICPLHRVELFRRQPHQGLHRAAGSRWRPAWRRMRLASLALVVRRGSDHDRAGTPENSAQRAACAGVELSSSPPRRGSCGSIESCPAASRSPGAGSGGSRRAPASALSWASSTAGVPARSAAMLPWIRVPKEKSYSREMIEPGTAGRGRSGPGSDGSAGAPGCTGDIRACWPSGVSRPGSSRRSIRFSVCVVLGDVDEIGDSASAWSREIGPHRLHIRRDVQGDGGIGGQRVDLAADAVRSGPYMNIDGQPITLTCSSPKPRPLQIVAG